MQNDLRDRIRAQKGPCSMHVWCLVLVGLLLGTLLLEPTPTRAQSEEEMPTITEKTEGMEAMDGFVPLYWDDSTGKIWMEISSFNEPFLYYTTLVSGLGSNPVGLDRGQTGGRYPGGGQQMVQFSRTGPTVHLEELNMTYRADTDNPAEEQAVREAFAPGVMWGFTVEAESPDGGAVLVDATDFVIRDAFGIVERLKESGQGTFALEKSRSGPYLENTDAFPQNTEMEAKLTFTTDEAPGEYVQQTAADPYAVTLRVRQSMIELPDTSGFEPRQHDPRSNFDYTYYEDYAEPIGTSPSRRLAERHRLNCAEPPGDDGSCPVEEPITYYLDPGTPEPVRTALLDGARWWADAFRAAGFEDAYEVKMLPEDAHPADVRYNVIEWVHRRTRGWSYGSVVKDPRTGEILKGDVALGSRRVRQDYLIAEGMMAPYEGEHADGFAQEEDPMLQMALDRIRQLSAHEVGHTLGLGHNKAASATPGERASVMDYPAPLVTVEDGSLSMENAYDTESVGSWDELAIRFGYEKTDPGQSYGELVQTILQEQKEKEIPFINTAEQAHPEAHDWENGSDAVEALDREMSVREYGLDRFGERVIQTGEPMALMEEVLVPLYLRHRYQVRAAAQQLGGVGYDYAMRGESDVRLSDRVSADQQRAALEGLLSAIDPETLALPKAARDSLPPRPPGHPDNRELFEGNTGPIFDTYAPAEAASSMVLGRVVQPERAMRLVQQHDDDPNLPGLQSVLSTVTDRVWKSPAPSDPYRAELQRTTQQVWTDLLLSRADHGEVPSAVQARMTEHLREIADWLEGNGGSSAETQAHRGMLLDAIERFLDRQESSDAPMPVAESPPGDPIGQSAPEYVQRQERRQEWVEAWAPSLPACFR